MTRIGCVVLLLACLGLTGCIWSGGPPHGFLPPIVEEYHACSRCGSLHGGIYGKGPLVAFDTATGHGCRHRWQLIAREEFKRRAATGFPEAWAKAVPFFHRPAAP